MTNFQESLNELMIENNLNRLNLAKIIGVSSTAINGYFNYNSFPSIATAIKIANTFKCSLDYLFGLTDNKTTSYEIVDNWEHNFLDNLYKLIKLSNTSIASTMKQLNIKENTYYNWRKGTIPSTTNILTVANFFDVSIDYLLFG